MSISLIENQPVYFVETGTNPEDLDGRGHYDYTIPIEYNGTDKTYIQIQVAPVAGSPNIVTPTLASSTTGWNATGSGVLITGLATIGDGSTGNVTTPPMDTTLIVGLNYQLSITVGVMFGTAYVYNGLDLIGTIEATGQYTFSFVATNDDITVSIEDDTSYIEFSDISIWNLPENYAIGILDINLLPVQVLTFIDNPTYFTLAKNTLTIVIDWTALALAKGCYYLAISDPETNTCQQFGLYNNNFTINNDETPKPSIDGWDGSDDALVTFQSYNAQITALAGTIQQITSDVNNLLCAGIAYEATINMAKLSAGSCTVTVLCGGQSSTQTVSSFDAADFVFSFTPAFDDYLRIRLDCTLTGNRQVQINSVNLILESILDWDFTFITPDPFQIQTLSPYQTKMVGLFGNEDGLGFVFEGSDFFPQVRVEAKFINRAYQSNRVDLENDIGTKSIMFGERRKNRPFRIENVPNYIHDFLSLSIIADHFYVDEIEYFVESDKYDPQYVDELDNFAPVEIILSNPTQLVRNINSGNSQQPPTSTGAGEIIAPRTAIALTEPSTGDTVEAL